MSKSVGIIILAAGSSTRFGAPKQIFKYQGESLVRRAALAALGCKAGPVIVSVGAEHDAVEKELGDLPITSIFNPRWQSGMSSSLVSALSYLITEHPQLDAVLFLLCDQPHVSSEMLTRLIETYETTKASIVAAEYSYTLGVPALFDRSLFSDLESLSGDEGARSVIKKYADQVRRVPMPEAAFDIDSMTDIENL